MNDPQTTTPSAAGIRKVGVDRVLAVLTDLASMPAGATLDEMARRTGDPKPTVHRALSALRRAGFAALRGRGHYVLGDEFLRLAFAHQEALPEFARINPLLQSLARDFGETTYFAVLDGRSAVYRAKVDPSSGAGGFSSTIGGRSPAHCTAVGKMLLSTKLHSLGDVEAWIGDRPLQVRTPRTIATADALFQALGETRRRGYALDDQESETGVNCLAVPVYLTSSTNPSGALSIRGAASRTPLSRLIASVDEIRMLVHEAFSAS